ncbi:MBL fold metallo-hydrolase [Papillibacter cinnamivorans]|uniref:Glyoxylase, beta-lactamase superfamily II n=1 Tax=Papillibacter cinnamivorans DSM 12816 TaxID=1122930 RepID=A0A1W2CP00_9FIRM|nr:MBL fold metallo-hydrolase [Papillibacter cinnamivorans]SMC86921.1 Glyoxylase, beta-lactamase superfamily II [Papillibacter cinnamivorans DSM 12816]
MYELIQVGERTYYIDCPAKIGIHLCREGAWLIDSGNDKEAGKKALRILTERSWPLLGIINTHSNADHAGGNAYLQEKTGCRILATGMEGAVIRYPVLEPSFLYGGYPCKPLKNKFLMAQPGRRVENLEQGLPEGLELMRLGGHFFDMVGIRTSDDVWFLADCLFGEEILRKYHMSFIYDVKAYLETLDTVEHLKAQWFVPAHAEAARDIGPLARLNREKVLEISETLLSLCDKPQTIEELLREVFKLYGLAMDFNQYVLVGSTLRSYLSYLYDQGKLCARFDDSRLLWEIRREPGGDK